MGAPQRTRCEVANSLVRSVIRPNALRVYISLRTRSTGCKSPGAAKAALHSASPKLTLAFLSVANFRRT
jgi:hypothetical protein